MVTPLDYITVETQPNPTSAVIWLHGLGSDGHDFESIVPALGLSNECATRFVFPHAPERPVTVNGGMRMRAWYDIFEMTLERKVDKTNIDESVEQVIQLIEAQIEQGVSSEKIVLAGFSQGGVIAYQVGFFGSYKLAGILALSTYLAEPQSISNASTSNNNMTPVLIHHGSHDPVVSPELGEIAKNTLVEKGYNVTSKQYPMPHSVCPEQITDISSWLKLCLS